jgi:hypothetical protein
VRGVLAGGAAGAVGTVALDVTMYAEMAPAIAYEGFVGKGRVCLGDFSGG